METRKYLIGAARKASDDVEKTRTIPFTASTSTIDGHGTVLRTDSWALDRFNSNGVIGYQHALQYSSDPDQVIGSGVARIEGKELIIDVTFEPKELNPLAEKIFRKILHKSLKACSVGFLPIGEGAYGNEERGENPDVYYFEGQELLELSIVNIPSNPDAKTKKRYYDDLIEHLRAEKESVEQETEKETATSDKTETIEVIPEGETAETTEAANSEDPEANGITAETERLIRAIEEKIILIEASYASLLIDNY